MISETCVPLPLEPGKPQRYDYEYKREGRCNLFLFFQPLGGWRHIKVTECRTTLDFAQCFLALYLVRVPWLADKFNTALTPWRWRARYHGCEPTSTEVL
jgi:hypothetical protein